MAELAFRISQPNTSANGTSGTFIPVTLSAGGLILLAALASAALIWRASKWIPARRGIDAGVVSERWLASQRRDERE
jgi:hypothetical protein